MFAFDFFSLFNLKRKNEKKAWKLRLLTLLYIERDKLNLKLNNIIPAH